VRINNTTGAAFRRLEWARSVVDVPPDASASVARAITTARKLIAGATSENTLRTYDTVWRQFTIHANGLGSSCSGHIRRSSRPSWGHCATGVRPRRPRASGPQRSASLHRAAGLASPTDQRVVRDLLEGARREDAGRDPGRATITAKRLAAALELQGPPATPIAIRDHAIVLLTGRWKSTAMLERYIEDGNRWDDNASVGIGL
jgi:hypothetical protein